MEKKSGKNVKSKTDTKTRSRSKKIIHSLPIVGLIVLIIALVATLVITLINFNTTPMKEIAPDAEIIGVPMERYFFDAKGGCTNSEDISLADGKVNAKDFSDELRERIVINFLVSQKYNGYPYDYINEVYQSFFGSDKNITERDTYETVDGKISKNEDGIYVASSNCAAPEVYTCVVLDKAYQSEKNDTLKATVGVFTVTSENGNIYPGLARDGEALGLRTDFNAAERMNDLPKWELTFKIDKSTGLYQLVSTNKLA
ncbi:hypothetical protein IJH16_00635 [Candidatus Saccharibacteria bacterium]|nr:hypothetical protein [Candidatus Saccharibacteria bacterium]MBQ3469470.1 hypothetical protein [Candidatus Saccharibacteria bacterium]